MSIRILQTVSVLWLLAFAMLVSGHAFGQDIEHAPTVDQCQADQRLWLSEVRDDGAKDWAHSATNTSARTLILWGHEMTICGNVDPNNDAVYSHTWQLIQLTLNSRVEDFVMRHGVWQQFLAEDKAGKR